MWQRTGMCLALLAIFLSPTAVLAEDVDDVVAVWMKHLERNPKSAVHGTARQYTYDAVFQTETHSRVEFWIDEAVGWRLDYAPSDVSAKTSERLGPNGTRYQLKSRGASERWSCAHDVFQVSSSISDRGPPEVRSSKLSADDSAAKSAIPILLFRDRSWLRIQTPVLLPGVCAGLPLNESSSKVGRRHQDWEFWLGSMHGKNNRIHLVLAPMADELKRELSQAELLLERTSYEPVGLRVIDPAGTSETVYVFDGIRELKQSDEAFSGEALSKWPPRCEPLHCSPCSDRPPAPPLARRTP